ncbi:MAG: hypothetical protein ACRCUX_10360 [Beijerinckiaceae bacterium]
MSVYQHAPESVTFQRHWPALAAIALAAILLIGFVLIPLRTPILSTSPRPVTLQIGKGVLEIDANALRRGAQRSGGMLERADLILSWPEFNAAQLVERDASGSPIAAQPARHVLLSLRAAEGADPARHTATLYGRFLDGETGTTTGGLIVRRFRDNSPYHGEELFISPPDGEEFAARCPQQTVTGAVNGRCLAQFRVGMFDATVNFDASLLPEWQHLRERTLGLIARAIR